MRGLLRRRRLPREFARWGAPLVLLGLACDFPTIPNPLVTAAATPPRSPGARAPRALLVGDSILDEHGSHAAVALREMGIDVRVSGLWGSGLFTRNQYDCGQTQPDPTDGSFSWLAEANRLIADFDPDLVAVYLNHNYWPPYPRTAAQCATPEDDSIAMGTPEFQAMARTQLREFVTRLRSAGAQVYLVDPVPTSTTQPADQTNFIWQSYLTLQAELGFGLIHAGDIVSKAGTGARIESMQSCFGGYVRVRPENDLHLTYFGGGLMGSALARGVAQLLGVDARGLSAPADAPAAIVASGAGYRLVTCDAATFAFGAGVTNPGGAALGAGRPEADGARAAESTASGAGYWLVLNSGKVLAFGDAAHHGQPSTALPLENGARGIAPTASAGGYWIATAQGEVRRFGDAAVLGDLAGQGRGVAGMAATPDRGGYWLVGADGRVDAFGTAAHFGDLAGQTLPAPIAAIGADAAGGGYWLLDRDGRVYAFGAAVHHGDASNQDLERIDQIIVGPPLQFVTSPVPASTTATHLLSTPSGAGYWVFLANGTVCRFGDAPRLGNIYRTTFNGFVALIGEPYYPATSPCN